MWYEIVLQGITEGIYTNTQLTTLKATGIDKLITSGDLTEEQGIDLKNKITIALEV